MLRVMLVDDEPMALEGLKLLIDWKKEGFTVCAALTSGVQALAELPQAKPNLIVTDISMADMDGLSLMHSARKKGYGGAFVIVSGYSDFAYAKEAMRIGVAGYLLKPVDPAEASQVLEHVRRELIDKELENKPPRAAWQQAITKLLMGQPVKGITLPQGTWQLFTWGAPLPYDAVASILERFYDMGLQATTHIVDGKEWLVLYAKSALSQAPCETLHQTLSQHRRALIESPVADHAERLPSLRKDMCAQLDDCANELLRRTQLLAKAISLLQYEEFSHRCDELISFCMLRGSTALTQAYELFRTCCGQQLADSPEKLSTFLCSPIRDIKMLGELAMRLLTPAPERIGDHVAAYLEEHYAKRLTLGSVAGDLGYNATYLGRIFREETGVGFRTWLNTLRLQKAAAILKSSPMPVHQVADAVGYAQYKQFLAHFKNCYGQTPQEYRKSFSP